jgi:aminopeptidase-like protein
VDSTRVASDRGSIWEVLQAFEATRAGSAAYEKAKTLYPICRSITGNGIRQSLRSLAETIPLQIQEVPTGTQVFDWTVPNEWNIRDAYIKNAQGERVVDFQRHNLHVLNYSVPVRQRMSLAELRPHLFSAPDAPEWIPYRTSYYREAWGFCLSQRQLETLPDGEYDVCIDSTLGPGHLSYGEYRISGATEDEVLISCHSCHPSLCNDNLSGMTVAAELARALDRVALRYSYRFIWIPGTIGAITWLAQHEALLPKIRHGLVLSCVGDSGPFTYKRSRHGNAEIDRAVEHVLKQKDGNARIREFIPYGYDERQYCSPGINLPVGCFMRTPNGEYPEYHSSADDLALVSPDALGQSVERLLEVVQVLEENRRWMNLSPKCEPQLGRRGLYRQTGGLKSTGASEMTMLWVLNYSDGQHDLLDIATRSEIPFAQIASAARALGAASILAPS